MTQQSNDQIREALHKAINDVAPAAREATKLAHSVRRDFERAFTQASNPK